MDEHIKRKFRRRMKIIPRVIVSDEQFDDDIDHILIKLPKYNIEKNVKSITNFIKHNKINDVVIENLCMLG